MKCRICGKPLTGEESWMGIGPVCRKHRAEGLQPSLIDLNPSTFIDEDLERMDPYDDIDRKDPKPIQVQKTHIENHGKEMMSKEPEIIDWDLLRGKGMSESEERD